MGKREMNPEHHAVKMTITYQDGHTEDFDTFLAAIAIGLTQVGTAEDGCPVYMGEEGFSSRGITHVTASTEVVASLLQVVMDMVGGLLSSCSRNGALKLLLALESMDMKRGDSYSDISEKEIHPKEN